MTRSYATPLAFKAALEARLRERAALQRRSLNRVRQLLVMERFLARVFPAIGSAVLKGGLVMELRLDRARATKDVDLRVSVRADELLDRLQAAGRLDLGDFLVFEVRTDTTHPIIEADGLRYDGQRFRAAARLAGQPYGSAFGVDIALGEPVVGTPQELDGSDTLAFVGVSAPRFRVYPVETHIAEKLHAYTLPRPRPNSRVKDLPDIALLAEAAPSTRPPSPRPSPRRSRTVARTWSRRGSASQRRRGRRSMRAWLRKKFCHGPTCRALAAPCARSWTRCSPGRAASGIPPRGGGGTGSSDRIRTEKRR